MEQYLNKGIKEVIDQYPEVEKILDEYGIGCGPCSDDPRNAGALAALRDIVGDLEGTISGGDDPVHRWQENSTLVYRRLVQFD